jgi:hypothetical protein
MKTRLASSMLAAAALTAAAGAQTVEFRIVEEALSGDASTVIAAPPSQGTTLGVSNLAGNYAVQARVTAGPGGVALGGFDFDIVILNEADANGQLVKMRISNPDGSYFTGSPALNAAVGTGGLARTYTYLAGINAAFNGQINTSLGTFSNNPAQQEIGLITASASGSALLGVPNMDPSGEGNVGTWSGYGLGATPLGGATASIDPTLGPTYFAQGQFIDINRFRYTISDTTGRTLNITLDHASAQVFSNFLFNNGSWGPQAATVDAGSVTVTPLVVTVGVPGACCDLGSGGCTLVLESLCTFGTFSAGACAPNPCPEPQGQCCDMNGCTTTTLAGCPQGNTWTLTCCNVASGACTTTTQPGCAAGNAWMVATTCTPNPCPAPPQGSCCVIATGACSETAQIDCASGSTWTLAGMCTPNTCVQPLGTCCNGNACTNTTQAACAVGNVWTLGAVCSAGVCPGTCCNVSTGTCSIQVASTCGLATHTWAAGGMCTPNPCEQPGACCDPATGNCQRLIASRCTGSSTWMMSSTCAPNPCPQPPGACCDPIGLTCTSTTQAGCASGSNWHAGLDCMTVVCPPAGTCCDSTNGACSLQIQDSCGTNNTWTTGGSCTPNPCPSPSACCNIFTGACTLSVAAATVAYSYTYTKGLGGYARSDLGGTVERINARFEPIGKRLVFDVQLSGAASGDPLTTAGFWLVLDRGPNPKAHPGELAIFYFDAQTLGSPLMTVYTYNGVDAGTSWSDGDPFALNDQPGDLIKGVYETSYINAIVAEDITVSGQPRRHMMFDIDASDIVAHVPQYLPVGGGAWFGTGFDLALGLWFHPVQSFAATYEANSGGARGGLASLTTGAEGWLDGTNRPTTDNDPCPSGSVISTQSACTPSNPCAPQRACCNATSGMCVVVYPLDDCPAGFVFASPAASSCSPSPCPSLARQPSGTCCNTLTGMCCVIPLSGCNPTAFAWLEGGTCATSGCPALQGACCNFITGGCTVLAQAACGTAAHDWSAGGACSSGECAAPGICCDTGAGTCRRSTRMRCTTGCTWAPAGACSPSPCSQTGACCNILVGTCFVAAQSACPPAAHDWMPVSCTPNLCAVPGVCCDAATLACTRRTPERCASGSVWGAGGAAACSPNPCAQPGTCCNVLVGTCQLTLQAACGPAAHDWSVGATCSPGTCAATGVCCDLASGACRRLTQARCMAGAAGAAGCVWATPPVCSPSPCGMPQGACCDVTLGTCAVVVQSECDTKEHDWVGAASCSVGCAGPGACCDGSSGQCRTLTQARCMVVEGTWLTGQTCTPGACSSGLGKPCAADFDRSGSVNASDVLAFVNAWMDSRASADFDGSSAVDAQDIFAFLNAWFAGCP